MTAGMPLRLRSIAPVALALVACAHRPITPVTLELPTERPDASVTQRLIVLGLTPRSASPPLRRAARRPAAWRSQETICWERRPGMVDMAIVMPRSRTGGDGGLGTNA